jgi:hypothetical protein
MMALEEAKPALTESPNSAMTERSESPYQQEEGSPTAERQQRQFIIIPEEHQLKASSNLALNRAHSPSRTLNPVLLLRMPPLLIRKNVQPEKRQVVRSSNRLSGGARDYLPIAEDRHVALAYTSCSSNTVSLAAANSA